MIPAIKANKIAQEELNAAILEKEAQLQTDSRVLSDYEKKCQSGTVRTEDFTRIMSRASTEAQAYALQTKGAAGSTQVFVAKQKQAQEELKATANASKTASVSMKLLSMAGNMIAMWAISAVLGAVVKSIDNFIHSSEKCKEAVDNLMSSYQESQNTLSSNKQYLDDVAQKYETLSKGVTNTGENISLTNAQFEEYNEISNKIASMFPSLVTGWDAQGNAILSCKDNIEELNESYKKAQQNAAYEFINDKSSKKILDNFQNQYNSDMGNEDKLNVITNLLNNMDTPENLASTIQNMNSDTKKYGSISKRNSYLMNFGFEFDHEDGQLFSGTITDEFVSNLRSTLAAEKATLESNINADLIPVKTLAEQYLTINKDNMNNNLSDQAQTIASSMIQGIDISLEQSWGKDEQEVQSYVNRIVNVLKTDSENPEVKKAMQELFTIDTEPENIPETKQQIDHYVNTIADYLNISTDSLKSAFHLESFDDLDKKYNESVYYAHKKTGASYSDIENLFQDNSINTNKEFNLWNQIVKENENAGLSIDELLDKYRTARKTILSEPYDGAPILDLGTNSETTNLGKLSEEIDTIQSAYSTLSSAIAEYNSQGSFSMDTMQSVIALGDNWLDYLVDENGMLALDEQALENLTKARMEDMKQQALSTLASNVSGIESETAANGYLASTNYNAAASYQALAQAKLADVEATLKARVENGDISTETYDKIIDKFKSDADKIQELFNSTDFTFSSDGISQSSMESLENHANILKSVKAEYEDTGIIAYSTLSSIAKAYPEMNEALRQYRIGLMTEQELFAELEKCYENDTDQYIQSLIEKSRKDEEFFNSLKINYPEIFNQLSENCYSVDVKNWTSMENAKLSITSSLKEKLQKIWSSYFASLSKTFGAYGDILENADGSGYTYVAGQDDSLDYDHTMLEDEWRDSNPSVGAFDTVKNEISGMINWANEAVGMINDAAYDQIESSINLSYDGLSGYDSDSNSKVNTKDYDLIERAVDKLNRKIASLGDTADDTFSSWSERSSALAEETNAVTEQIALQQQAQAKYMELADSVGLDEYYKNLIINGDVDILTVEDEDLQNQIDLFMDYYDKAQEAADTVSDLNRQLKELEQQKFDNITAQFEAIKNSISHAVNMLNSCLDLADAKGYFATEELYQKLIAQEQNNLSALYNEQAALTRQLQEADKAGISKDSEDYIKMQNELNNVNEAILDSIINIQKLNNNLENLDFKKFDFMENQISNLTSEADFYISLMESMGKDLYDENGKFTNEGLTTAGLHAQNYSTYLQQAKDYAGKIEEINKQLADDPANQTLLEQQQKYVEAQREAVSAAQDERNAIIDLIRNGYDKQLESLSNLIDQYKEQMSLTKDAYDYEKNMAEKTKNLADLRKQYAAYQNDDSEEGMKKRQELGAQIEEAEDDIKQTEYEKMISDTERLLDDLQSEYENLINQRMDNIDTELNAITNAVNSNASSISETLSALSMDSGLPLTQAVKDIWSNPEPVASIGTTVDTVNESVSGTKLAIESIKDTVQYILAKSEDDINKQISDTDDGSYDSDNTQSPQNNNESGSDSSGSDSSGSDASGSSSGHGVDWIHSPDSYPKDQLNIEESIVDRLKYHDYDSRKSARAQYYEEMGGEGTYTGSADQNIWMLNWMKAHGYARGTRFASKGFHFFDEQGFGTEAIITKNGILTQFAGGESVFNKEQVARLHELADMQSHLALSRMIPEIPEFICPAGSQNTTMNYSCGDISFVLPNVKNYDDIMQQAQRDKRFETMVQEMVIGQTFGNNSFKKLKF